MHMNVIHEKKKGRKENKKKKKTNFWVRRDIKLFPTLNPNNATNQKEYMQKRREHIVLCAKHTRDRRPKHR